MRWFRSLPILMQVQLVCLIRVSQRSAHKRLRFTWGHIKAFSQRLPKQPSLLNQNVSIFTINSKQDLAALFTQTGGLGTPKKPSGTSDNKFERLKELSTFQVSTHSLGQQRLSRVGKLMTFVVMYTTPMPHQLTQRLSFTTTQPTQLLMKERQWHSILTQPTQILHGQHRLLLKTTLLLWQYTLTSMVHSTLIPSITESLTFQSSMSVSVQSGIETYTWWNTKMKSTSSALVVA